MKVVNLDDIRHGIRVANYSVEIAKKINLPSDKIQDLYISGLFHDIGKAYINQTILNKPGALTDKERKVIEQHPIHSYNEIISMGYTEDIALNILHHHENWNGTGYPKGLKGLTIPIGARILKLSDVFDALTMERPYRKKLTVKEALLIMNNEKELYDPELYLIFASYLISKFKEQLIRPCFVNDGHIMQLHNRELSLYKEI